MCKRKLSKEDVLMYDRGLVAALNMYHSQISGYKEEWVNSYLLWRDMVIALSAFMEVIDDNADLFAKFEMDSVKGHYNELQNFCKEANNKYNNH